ncbi:MAG: hypothetical protein M5U23_09280 [Acidimicrobiia bacterium]|nr:hypothetical protein [Acidimicrobiia bacterium]
MPTFSTLGLVALLILVIAFPGIPAAILLKPKQALRVAPTVAVGLFIGFGIVLVVVVGLVHLGIYAVPIFLGTVAAISVGLWIAVYSVRPTILPPRITAPGIAMTVIMFGAAFLRTDPIYFIYQTSDFGGYINIANRVAIGDAFGYWFLDLFPAALSIPAVLFGTLHTVVLMPLLGLLIVVGVAAISDRLGFSPWVTVTAGFISAFHIVPVWFSEFPASETLFAVLLIGMLLVLATAVTKHSIATATAAGMFGFLLAIARVNSILLVPIVLLATVVALVLMNEKASRIVSRFIGVFFAASYVGLFYNIRFSSPYFVDDQLGLFFPDFVPRAVDRLGNPLIAVGIGCVFGALVWGLIALARTIASKPGLARRASLILAFGVVGGLIAFLGIRAASGNYSSPGGQVLILGLVLLALGLGGMVVGGLSLPTSPPERQAMYWIAVLTAVGFIALQATRLDQPGNEAAPYFLYWHRYYMSEVFPVIVILAMWSLEAATLAVTRYVMSDRWRRHVPALVAAGVITIIGFEALGPNIHMSSATMFDQAYEVIAELDDLTSDPPDAPIVYLGSNELPLGWFWPNTARLIARPLADTFDRWIIGNAGPREPDLTATSAQLVGILEDQGVDTIFVITDRLMIPDPDVLLDGGWDMQEIAFVPVTIQRLQWEPDTRPKDQLFAVTTLELYIYEMNR